MRTITLDRFTADNVPSVGTRCTVQYVSAHGTAWVDGIVIADRYPDSKMGLQAVSNTLRLPLDVIVSITVHDAELAAPVVTTTDGYEVPYIPAGSVRGGMGMVEAINWHAARATR